MNSSTVTHGLVRRLVTAALALAMALTLLPLFARPASAAATYRSGGFACQNTSFGRRVMAYPPGMTSSTGALQMVYWSPDLYRWDGVEWRRYDGSKPWYFAVANSNGVQYNTSLRATWVVPNSHNALRFAEFSNLPRGHYMVMDHYRWGATGHYAPASYVDWVVAWSPYVGGGRYCTFS